LLSYVFVPSLQSSFPVAPLLGELDVVCEVSGCEARPNAGGEGAPPAHAMTITRIDAHKIRVFMSARTYHTGFGSGGGRSRMLHAAFADVAGRRAERLFDEARALVRQGRNPALPRARRYGTA